jgi:hypothetical protein
MLFANVPLPIRRRPIEFFAPGADVRTAQDESAAYCAEVRTTHDENAAYCLPLDDRRNAADGAGGR